LSRGIVSDGALIAHYYTAEPSPDRWIAVGTVMFLPEQPRSGSPRWMLVGEGSTERQAIADLRTRMIQYEPPRWRIKCDPPAPEFHRRNEERHDKTSGRFVVPWEIDSGEESVPFGTPTFDFAMS